MMKSVTCFLIDDDEDDRDLFQAALAEVSDNLTFAYAQTAMEALRILADKLIHPHFIFLDVNMPLMPGDACLLELRKLSHLDPVPVYIYTTSANHSAKASYLSKGAQHVLIKPNRMEDLISMLRELLQISKR